MACAHADKPPERIRQQRIERQAKIPPGTAKRSPTSTRPWINSAAQSPTSLRSSLNCVARPRSSARRPINSVGRPQNSAGPPINSSRGSPIRPGRPRADFGGVWAVLGEVSAERIEGPACRDERRDRLGDLQSVLREGGRLPRDAPSTAGDDRDHSQEDGGELKGVARLVDGTCILPFS